MMNLFDLTGEVVVITGAAGLLGKHHAEAIAEAGGIPVLIDINALALTDAVENLKTKGFSAIPIVCDVLNEMEVKSIIEKLEAQGLHPTALVNNVAANPAMNKKNIDTNDFASYPSDIWDNHIEIGIKAAFLFSRAFGPYFAKAGRGNIVNIASDLAIISPDQRIYRDPAVKESEWPTKPVTYSVTKSALLGLTRYLSTYWSPTPVRVNALVLGSVESNQSDFLKRNLEDRIPLGRLANPDEYKGLLVFILSRASSYMTGSILVADGGRSVW